MSPTDKLDPAPLPLSRTILARYRNFPSSSLYDLGITEFCALCDQALAAISEREARLEAERDAKRYRMVHNGDVPDYAMMLIKNEEDRINSIDGEALDKAIDAEMKPATVHSRKRK